MIFNIGGGYEVRCKEESEGVVMRDESRDPGRTPEMMRRGPGWMEPGVYRPGKLWSANAPWP